MDGVVCKNFEKCYDDICSVDWIGRYFFGNCIIGLKFLFEYFYNEDGLCKGEDIEKIFWVFYVKFVDWCIVILIVERMIYNNMFIIYRNECLGMNKNIIDYMIYFYGKCIKLLCFLFYLCVFVLFKNFEKVDSFIVYNVL